MIPHGIDIEEFLNEPVKKKPRNPFVFGSTGSFADRKNQELLIEAFNAEFKRDPNVKLKIIENKWCASNFKVYKKLKVKPSKKNNKILAQKTYS